MTDGAGNSGTASFTWTIDTDQPVGHDRRHPDDPTSTTGADFTFTGDAGTGTAIAATTCKLDGGALRRLRQQLGPDLRSPLADGSHTFTVKVTDGAGNVGTASYTWTIDTANPSVTIGASPDDPTSATGADFTFTGDAGTGTRSPRPPASSTAASSSPATAARPRPTSALADGSHTFTVKVTDGAGNSGTATYTWTIDTGQPVGHDRRQPGRPDERHRRRLHLHR